MIAVGTVLHDTYRLDALIGQGGMGSVFRATHLRVPRPYAIKVLEARIAEREGAFQRFRREAEVCSRLGHPNIVEVYDFNRTEDGHSYYVMELLEGRDLAQAIADEAPMPLARVLEILEPVASALLAAHRADVVHRDLKPQNLFLAQKAGREQAKILDFGISKIVGSVDQQTRSESVMGTPLYMSPEQARGDSKHVDPRADQFALGAIAYEMLSGRRAFKGGDESPFTILYRIVNGEPDQLFEAGEPVAEVIERALAKDPARRFADVGAFVAALAEAGRVAPSEPWRRPTPAAAPAVAPGVAVERTLPLSHQDAAPPVARGPAPVAAPSPASPSPAPVAAPASPPASPSPIAATEELSRGATPVASASSASPAPSDAAAGVASPSGAVGGAPPASPAAPVAAGAAASAHERSAGRGMGLAVGGLIAAAAVAFLLVRTRAQTPAPPSLAPAPVAAQPSPVGASPAPAAAPVGASPSLAASPVAAPPPPAAAPVAAPAVTRLPLVVTPPGAHVLVVAPDGSSRRVDGPFAAADARELTWPTAAPPAELRVEAEGYEPASVPLPAPGRAPAPAEVHLRRRRPAPKPPATHHELSYPWKEQ
jgi:serine/threonine-protein kinase